MTTLLLPTTDEALAQDLAQLEFTEPQIAFLKALLTATQKERLGLHLDPEMKPQYLMAHASLVGKEEQLVWLIEAAESVNHDKEGTTNPFNEVQNLPVTAEELSVIEAGFDDYLG